MSNSSITTDPRDLPCHPGEVIREEFMADYALDAAALAGALGVARGDVEAVLAERAPVTPDLAVRLGRLFETTAQFWMNMQVRRDLEIAARAAAKDIDAIKPIHAA
jgi:addiction module HigA family antidote